MLSAVLAERAAHDVAGIRSSGEAAEPLCANDGKLVIAGLAGSDCTDLSAAENAEARQVPLGWVVPKCRGGRARGA